MFKPKALGLILLFTVNPPATAENLLEVYQEALLSAPQLKAAGFKLEVGAAEKGQALGQMLPQVNGTANWSENTLQQPNVPIPSQRLESYKGTRYFVSLTQTLIDFGKFSEWQRTRELEKQYEAEHIDTQQNLMVDIINRYFSILDAEDQLRFIDQEKQATETYVEQINKLFAKQLAKITDVYEVEARLDQIKADQIEAESLLSTAKEALKELTNVDTGNLSRLREGIDYKELDGKLEDWLQVALSQSPALAVQRQAIAVANGDLAVQRSKYLPVVDLQLYFYDTNTGYQSVLLSSEIKTQVAAINVNVPIFSGGTTTERVNEAQGTLNIKKEENEAKIRALIKETSEAFTLSNANAKRIRASQKAVLSAGKSLEAMQSGFKYGVNTIRHVLEAQQDEFKAQRDLAKAKYNYIANRIRFLKAIGTINEDNLFEVNDWLTR